MVAALRELARVIRWDEPWAYEDDEEDEADPPCED
jgi:hypothetical protein